MKTRGTVTSCWIEHSIVGVQWGFTQATYAVVSVCLLSLIHEHCND